MAYKFRNKSDTHNILAAYKMSFWIPFAGFEQWRRKEGLPVGRGRDRYRRVIKDQIREDLVKLLADKYGITEVEFWY